MIKRLTLALGVWLVIAAAAFGQFSDQGTWGGTGGGSANAQTVTVPNVTALADLVGVQVRFIAGATNTGATTLSISSTAATAIRKQTAAGLAALTGNEIVSGQIVSVVYDGTFYELVTGPPAVASLCGTNGLTIANNSGTPNSKIDIAASQVLLVNDTGNVPNYSTSLSSTVDLTASGANGLDTGSVAALTWYNLFAISNGATTGGLASLSATAPTMPSGYVYRCRLGAMQTDASKNLLRSKQAARQATYTVTAGSNTASLPKFFNGTTGSGCSGATPTYTAFAVANFVPPTARRILVIAWSTYSGSAASQVLVVPSTGNYGGSSAGTNPPVLALGGADSNVRQADILLETTSIYACSSAVGGALFTYGWTDSVNAN